MSDQQQRDFEYAVKLVEAEICSGQLSSEDVDGVTEALLSFYSAIQDAQMAILDKEMLEFSTSLSRSKMCA